MPLGLRTLSIVPAVLASLAWSSVPAHGEGIPYPPAACPRLPDSPVRIILHVEQPEVVHEKQPSACHEDRCEGRGLLQRCLFKKCRRPAPPAPPTVGTILAPAVPLVPLAPAAPPAAPCPPPGSNAGAPDGAAIRALQDMELAMMRLAAANAARAAEAQYVRAYMDRLATAAPQLFPAKPDQGPEVIGKPPTDAELARQVQQLLSEVRALQKDVSDLKAVVSGHEKRLQDLEKRKP
jgi:hypothetical protein